MTQSATASANNNNMQDKILESDTGDRHPGPLSTGVLLVVLLTWSLFQLWIQNLQFSLGTALGLAPLNSTETRSVHLAFAMFLAFLAYPARRDLDNHRTLIQWFAAWKQGEIKNAFTRPHRDLLILAGSLIYFIYLFFKTDEILAWLGSETIDTNDVLTAGIMLMIIVWSMLGFPIRKRSNREYIPVVDWFMAFAGAYCAGYLFLYYDALSMRPGLPTSQDIVVSVVGMLLLLEATRRSLGPPLMIVASVFLFYTFAGAWDYMPEMISHKGQSLEKVSSHQWLTTEGVFGIALGVSSSFVFLFVLFGALLEKAGAGNYFIKVAFSLMGHLRGGPAKAAVLSSAMTGMISGSSIANVVTTGTFTVPLMKRVGFSSEKAGAVEVGSSVNGQIMPPVMGAAAFLMTDYVGISYVEVIKHAFLPALISYIALLYIVHLEAVKTNMSVLEKPIVRSLYQSFVVYGITILSIIILSGAVYFGLGWIKDVAGDTSGYIAMGLLAAVYFALLKYQAKYPDLEMDDPNAEIVKLPETAATVKTGLHYVLPIVVLVWLLIVERQSPGESAYWASLFLMLIVITQKPLLSLLRGEAGNWMQSIKQGGYDLFDGLTTGARNMIGIGVATAAAGIIVGTVSLTGIGQVMTEVVETISGGNFILVLIFTAIISLILGMGLPTTANYIVVSSLMAPVIVALSAQSGIIVPLIAVHLFVFYFGIMADVTPPVGLASFAAAAVSRGDPIRTGVQAFFYSTRTMLLPFLFIFNPKLLLIGVSGFWDEVYVFLKATIAMLLFAAGTQGYFFARSYRWESALLLLISFTLFYPKFWIDQVVPPYVQTPPQQIEEVAGKLPEDASIRLQVTGEDAFGDQVSFVARLPLSGGETGAERLEGSGLYLREENGKVYVDDLGFNSEAEKAGLDFDFEIEYIEVPQEQPSDQWPVLPAVLLMVIMALWQRQRKKQQQVQPA